MSTLAGSSLLQEFLDFMASRARHRATAGGQPAEPDNLRHDVDALVALALAAYKELGEWTREITAGSQPDPTIIATVREAHSKYLQACAPMLHWIEQARSVGVEARELDTFMASVGEARLIAERFEQVMESERQADRGDLRNIREVRDALRHRVHPTGG
jgi:hypothetical protein